MSQNILKYYKFNPISKSQNIYELQLICLIEHNITIRNVLISLTLDNYAKKIEVILIFFAIEDFNVTSTHIAWTLLNTWNVRVSCRHLCTIIFLRKFNEKQLKEFLQIINIMIIWILLHTCVICCLLWLY